jgi:hypothetical protein
MTSRLRREHDAQAAMLAYRTGLNVAICKAWMETAVAKSAEAIKAAFMRDSDDNSINVARSEIEAYALSQVKKRSRGGSWLGIGSRIEAVAPAPVLRHPRSRGPAPPDRQNRCVLPVEKPI